MSTTTICLPEALTTRTAKAAEAASTSSHNLILEAIAGKAALAWRCADLHAVADQRHARFLESGESIPWEDARTWLKQRLAGKRVKRPTARKRAR